MICDVSQKEILNMAVKDLNCYCFKMHLCFSLYFSPGLFVIPFFSFYLIYGVFGFGGLGLCFRGWGFQLMRLGACDVGPHGFLGLGLSI